MTMFRDRFVTEFHGHNPSLSEKQSVAFRMQHSVAMAETIYDRRTAVERAALGTTVMQNLNARLLCQAAAPVAAASAAAAPVPPPESAAPPPPAEEPAQLEAGA
jgi:hypothetical protein